MFSAVQLRLKWFLKEYLLNAAPQTNRIQLLDVGRYEANPERQALLESERVEYFRLQTCEASEEEVIAKDPYNFTEHPDGSYDIAISTHALEHILEPERTIREIFRILRPGGIFFLIEPAAGEKTAMQLEGETQEKIIRINAYNRHQYLPDYFRFNIETLVAMTTSAGLISVHQSQNYGPADATMEWFRISEAVLVAMKPNFEETLLPQAAYTLPLSWSEAFMKDWNEKRGQKETTLPYCYTKTWKKDGLITMLGNCITTVAFLYLRAAVPNYDFQHIFFTDPILGRHYVERPLTPETYEDSDILFVSDLPKFANLTCRGGVTVYLPTPYFRGYHPDFTGPFIMPFRAKASNIACECCLRGYSESKALEYFNHQVYSRLGYYSAWEEDVESLRHRFTATSLSLDTFLPSWMRKGVFMCDTGHPMDFVIVDIVNSICKRLGITVAPGFTYNHFSFNFQNRLPVFPEIAAFLGIPEIGSYSFRRTIPNLPPFQKETHLSLDEYVHLLYHHINDNRTDFDTFQRLEQL